MQDLHSQPITQSAQSANYPTVASPLTRALPRASILSFALVAYMIIGVPVLFAINILQEEEVGRGIPLTLLVAFIVLAFLNHKDLLRQRVRRFFFLYFLTLLFTGGLALVATNPFAESAQLTSLLSFFSWSSVFISIYYLTSDFRVYQFAVRLVDKLGLALAFSVYLSYIGPEFLEFSFGEVQRTTTVVRAFGPFGDQVGFALSYFALRGLTRQKWLIAILCLGAILFTGTRGAVISLAIGAVWLVINLRGQSRRVVKIALVTGLAVLLYVSIFQNEGFSRFEDVLLNDDALLQRRSAIELGFRIFADNPVFGIGYLGFNRMIDQYGFVHYFEIGSDIVRGAYTAQNQYLQTATDAGVLGLAALGLFLGSVWIEFRRARHHVADKLLLDLFASSAWVVALVLGNLAAVWLLPAAITSYLFCLVTGLTLGLIRLQERGLVPEDSAELSPLSKPPKYAR